MQPLYYICKDTTPRQIKTAPCTASSIGGCLDRRGLKVVGFGISVSLQTDRIVAQAGVIPLALPGLDILALYLFFCFWGIWGRVAIITHLLLSA